MFSRPLVPALCATIIGILTGHTILTNLDLPLILFPLAILLCLGIFLVVPFKIRSIYLMSIFVLVGINSQIHKPTLSGSDGIIDKNERVVIEGTIYGPPKVRANAATLPLHGEKMFLGNEIKKVKINLLVRIYGYRGGLRVGERIRCPARLKEFKNFNNPGRFDYQFYMKSRGLSYLAIVSHGRYVVPMGKGDLGLVGGTLEKLRGRLRRFFCERLSDTISPLYGALILGERQGLTSALREPFDRSGVGHIMAVSGLHLGLVAWLSFMSLRWLLSFSYRLTLMTDIRRLAAIVTTVPVLAYGSITGLQVSSQRAMVMVLVFLWSFIMGREKDVWSSLSLAALIILILKGDALFTTSFQLSFVAVAGILWLAPMILSRLPRLKTSTGSSETNPLLHPILAYTAGLVAVTTAATIITIPLIAYHFHRFSVVALAANLTVVPIIGLWVIPLGLLSSATLFLSSGLAGFLLSLGEFGLNLAISLVQFWSDIPWSSVWVIRPSWLEILLLYGLLYLGLRFPYARSYRILLVVLLAILLVDVGYWVYQTRLGRSLRVTVLDVGRGNAAFIQFPGKQRMLVAHNVFGPRGFHLPRIAIAPYLWHNKITRIDYLFLIDPYIPPSERLQFMVGNFHVREVISNFSKEWLIDKARISGGVAGEVTVAYSGWSFRFSEEGAQIHKETQKIDEEGSEFLIITNQRKMRSPGIPVIKIPQAGAITVSIDQNGGIHARSFLKKNLPLFEGGS